MKFSDMMGQGDEGGTDVEQDAPALPPLPPAGRTTPSVPEAPVQFGGNRSEPANAEPEAAAPEGEASIATPDVTAPPAATPAEPAPVARGGDPLLSDVVAELAPRPGFTGKASASDEQLDTSAWLDGLGSIDDDLLPR